MTLAEFVQNYASHSGTTVLDLFLEGYRAYPCECGESMCEGFQILRGDVKAQYDLSQMLGKPVAAFSVAELKTAFAVSDKERFTERHNPSIL